jgi:hypothetical protein
MFCKPLRGIQVKIGSLSKCIYASIVVGAGLFIAALLISAIFEPSIRVLHTLQALPYVVIIILTRKNSAWAYGAGGFIAGFWNYMAIFVNTFVQNGVQQLVVLIRTGQVDRPDQLIAVVAAGGHFLLILACLAGFLRMRPGIKQWGQFLAGGVLAVSYFVAIIVATGPQYVDQLKRVFHL